MDKDYKDYLRREIDKAARLRVESGYLDCDPESLSSRALEAEILGFPEVAQAFRNFRDNVVNQLIGEGWSVERIEAAMLHHWEKNG
jgi:hypothetical protein